MIFLHGTIINKRLLNLMSSEGIQNPEPHSKSKGKKRKKSSFRQRISAKLSTGDVSGAVNILSSNDTILFPSPEVLSELKKKHPSIPSDRLMPQSCDKIELIFGREEVKSAINSFKPGSSGGPDGLNP